MVPMEALHHESVPKEFDASALTLCGNNHQISFTCIYFDIDDKGEMVANPCGPSN